MTMVSIDPTRCAVLSLDLTDLVVDRYAPNGPSVVSNCTALYAAARVAGCAVWFVIPGEYDRDGHGTSTMGRLHPDVVPESDQPLLYKSKIGAFSTTGLDLRLRETGRDTLIITGVATSGCVLSTARWGFDQGYQLIVVKDACSDPNPDVHAALTEHVHEDSWIGLWRVANVVTTAEAIKALSG